jgi:hypothetical protein
MCGEGALRR